MLQRHHIAFLYNWYNRLKRFDFRTTNYILLYILTNCKLLLTVLTNFKGNFIVFQKIFKNQLKKKSQICDFYFLIFFFVISVFFQTPVYSSMNWTNAHSQYNLKSPCKDDIFFKVYDLKIVLLYRSRVNQFKTLKLKQTACSRSLNPYKNQTNAFVSTKVEARKFP